MPSPKFIRPDGAGRALSQHSFRKTLNRTLQNGEGGLFLDKWCKVFYHFENYRSMGREKGEQCMARVNSSGWQPAAEGVDPRRVPQRLLFTGMSMPAIGLGTFGSDSVSGEAVAAAVGGAAAMACSSGSPSIKG